MPAELLDATSSPSNRFTPTARSSSCSGGFIDEAVLTALYAVSSDDTEFVLASHDRGDPWDDASLDARLCRAHVFAGSPPRHTDYRVAPFLSAAFSQGQLEGPFRDRGTSYDAAAFRLAPDPVSMGLDGLAAALERQIDLSGMVRTAVEVLRSAFRGLTNLDAEQVRGIREAIEELHDQLAGAEVVSIPVEDQPLLVPVSRPPNPWTDKLLRLKRLTALTDAEIAQLFGVSRSNVQGWLHRDQGMHPVRQRRLLEVLKVLEDAHDRLGGDEQRLRQALLTPAGPEGQAPFDYLAQSKYLVARGYLQSLAQPETERRANAHRAPIRPVVRLSEPTRLAALEALSPSPRVDADPG